MTFRSTRYHLLGPADSGMSAAGPAGNGGAVLDEQALDKLRELDPKGQNGLLDRVFKAFDSSAVRLMGQLAEARLTNDLHAIRHVTHTLKSSSASIGAMKLSRLCADIESMVRQSNSDGLPERLDVMDGEVDVVLAAVRAMQGGAR
jgi:two-component system, sensor histidine kinase and response regulator